MEELTKPDFVMLQLISFYFLSSLWVTVSFDLAVFHQQPGSVRVVHVCSISVSASPHPHPHPHPRRRNASLEMSIIRDVTPGLPERKKAPGQTTKTAFLIFSSLFFHCPSLWVFIVPISHDSSWTCNLWWMHFSRLLLRPLAPTSSTCSLPNQPEPPRPLNPPPPNPPQLLSPYKCDDPAVKKGKKTLFQRASSSSLLTPLLPWTPGAHIAHRKLVQVLLIFSQLSSPPPFFFFAHANSKQHADQNNTNKACDKDARGTFWSLDWSRASVVADTRGCFFLVRLILSEFFWGGVKGEAAFICQSSFVTEAFLFLFS